MLNTLTCMHSHFRLERRTLMSIVVLLTEIGSREIHGHLDLALSDIREKSRGRIAMR